MTDQPFHAVIFDLDGTLIATDRFWPQAAREGALAAFAELGIEREPPSSAQWMSMVGLPLGEGFDQVFADLPLEQRRLLEVRCLEAEHQTLRRGGVALLPGVEKVLRELRRRGVRTGIASNCHDAYLRAMWEGVGLRELMDEARCLESPGIGNKADMIEDLLETFGTRRAFMVGDRLGDRDAAYANGLPHVHLARGYAGVDERVECEAVIDGFDRLLPLIDACTLWMDAIACELVGLEEGAVVGVSGGPGVGKSLFADALAGALRRHGRSSRRVDAESFVRAAAPAALAEADPEAFAAARYELGALLQALAPEASQPSGAAAPGVLSPAAGESAGQPAEPATRPLTLLEGEFLATPALRDRLAFLIQLEAPVALCQRRLVGRDARCGGLASVQERLQVLLPLQAAFQRGLPARVRAELVIDLSNLLEPASL